MGLTVDWLLGRFRQRTRPRAPLVCYLRENGPIAYSTQLFAGDPRERADGMLSTDLTWFWTARPESIAREWTHLTRWSLAALLADIAAARDTAAPRILIVGVDDSVRDAPGEVTDARVAGWMRGFAAAAPGPLHAVVTHPGPGGDLLFVAQQPPESIRALLQAWGINRDKAERKAYARLRGSDLEDVIGELVRR